MNISVVIAQVMGIFFVVVGISMVANSQATKMAVEDSIQNKGVLWVWGLLATLIGATVVAFNNMWAPGVSLLVAVLGWLALIKGVFILIFPAAAASLYRKCNKNGMLVCCGIVAFILGLILLYW